jgi:leucyl aminopeptidase
VSRGTTIGVSVTSDAAADVAADLLAVAVGSEVAGALADRAGPHVADAAAEADPVAVVHAGGLAARRIALVALDGSDSEALRTAAARAVRALRGGGTVAWALDHAFPLPPAEQVGALVEGAVLAGYDAARWKSGARARRVERFVVCDVDAGLAGPAERAATVAEWTNFARELVDAPPNRMRPEDLAARARALPGVRLEVLPAHDAGAPALAAVGASSSSPPLLIVLRYEPDGAPETPRLGLVGKAVTFDSGGYFLKQQADIVRQKADMAGGAAVIAALGAIAELDLPLRIVGVVAACENMLGGGAIRPSDVIDTAAGITVEVTNPDAEGRLILADALAIARREGATHLVDLATLTGAMRAGMGDLYGGVFANEAQWREAVVDAGNATGDLAWPWPMSSRYDRLLESRVADVKNTSGKGFGYPITAAAFLQKFAGSGPWAHVDMIGPALLDEDRGDALGQGASGYGVRMLVELATRLATGNRPTVSAEA